MSTYDKGLKLLEEEHSRLAHRVALLKNPVYAVDLEDKVEEF